MRKIELEKIKSDLTDEWLDQAEIHLKNLNQLSLEEKKKYISDNSDFWGGDIRLSFWLLGLKKCWYSEEQLSFKDSELEHYRPKGKVAKTSHPGYWWLAFNWRNYRIASSIVNKRAKDERNNLLQGKGTYFPLVAESERSFDYKPSRQDILSIGNEHPILLDPTDGYDVSLIGFDFLEGKYEGRITARKDTCQDDIDEKRVSLSVDFFDLNNGHLMDRRYAKYVELETSCEIVETLFEKRSNGSLSDVDKKLLKKHYNIITQMVSPHAEFSTMCRTALEDLGSLGWNSQILRTA